MIEIKESYVVYDGKDSRNIRSATFTDICVMPSGRILVSFRGGPTKTLTNIDENGYVCYSDDGGKTFSEPYAPFGSVEIDGKDTGHVRNFQLLPLGGDKLFGVASVVEEIGIDLPYFNDETEAIKNTQLYYFFSEDGGKTFTKPERIYMKSLYVDKACVLTGPPVLLKDGRIMVNFEVYKTYYDTGDFGHNAGCIYSDDGGKSWGEEVIVCERQDVYGWDHRATEVGDGHLVDYVWAFERATNSYLNIHMTESFDGGYTWTDLLDVGLPGQAGNPCMLPDGRLSLVYFDRTDIPTLKLAISEDMGKTFGGPVNVYVHEAPKAEGVKSKYSEAWAEMGKYTAGHCFQALSREGDLIVANYAGPEQHQTNAMITRVKV